MAIKKHHSVYFALFQKIERRLAFFSSMREKGIVGIGVDKDEYAVRWQQHQMKREILYSFLSNKTPNWANSYYLPISEAIKRNEGYLMTNQTIKQQRGLMDLKHCTSRRHKREVCLGSSIEKDRPYPSWYEWAFFGAVTVVFAVAIMGFVSIV